MSKTGKSIIKGAKQALSYMQGDKTKGRARQIMESRIDVKAIRAKTGLSQTTFASTYGFSISNIKKWETGVREPVGPTKAYLTVIRQHPKIVKDTLEKEY